MNEKKILYCKSYIKQDVYTVLFYFLRLSCSHSSHSLLHFSLELSKAPFSLVWNSCVISLCESAQAYSTSGKELNTSSQEYIRFSGCFFDILSCFHIILRWLALILHSPILLINSLFFHILTMVFFYSKIPLIIQNVLL